jgi:hypothetical protein
LLLYLSLQQAAIRQAMRATAAAEAERDALKQQLQDAETQQQAASKGQEAAEQQEQLQQENGEPRKACMLENIQLCLFCGWRASCVEINRA